MGKCIHDFVVYWDGKKFKEKCYYCGKEREIDFEEACKIIETVRKNIRIREKMEREGRRKEVELAKKAAEMIVDELYDHKEPLKAVAYKELKREILKLIRELP